MNIRLRFKNEQFFVRLTKCTFFLLIISVLMQVTLTNKYSVKGSELVSYEAEKEELLKEISLLQLDISEISSLSYLEEKAISAGFSKYTGEILTIGSNQFASAAKYR